MRAAIEAARNSVDVADIKGSSHEESFCSSAGWNKCCPCSK
ncbi:MAG: hypothetical protein AAB251_02985 [Deltaproteobacteria bacterium]